MIKRRFTLILLSFLMLVTLLPVMNRTPLLAEEESDSATVDLRVTVVAPCRVYTLGICNLGKRHAHLLGLVIPRCRCCEGVWVNFGWSTVSHAEDPSGYEHWTWPEYRWWYGMFCAPVTRLKPDTTYYFRAKAVCGGAVVYGEEMCFRTLKEHRPWWQWW